MTVQFLGVPGSVVDGVFLTEFRPEGGQPCGGVRVEVSRQNTHLNEIKRRLAVEARKRGANAVRAFRYGQKAINPWELRLRWDSELWYGEGEAVRY